MKKSDKKNFAIDTISSPFNEDFILRQLNNVVVKKDRLIDPEKRRLYYRDQDDSGKVLANKELRMLQLRDIRWNLDVRGTYAKILIGVLIFQNAATFIALFYAVRNSQLEAAQAGLGLIVTATLGETAGLVTILYKFLFKDIPYTFHELKD